MWFSAIKAISDRPIEQQRVSSLIPRSIASPFLLLLLFLFAHLPSSSASSATVCSLDREKIAKEEEHIFFWQISPDRLNFLWPVRPQRVFFWETFFFRCYVFNLIGTGSLLQYAIKGHGVGLDHHSWGKYCRCFLGNENGCRCLGSPFRDGQWVAAFIAPKRSLSVAHRLSPSSVLAGEGGG